MVAMIAKLANGKWLFYSILRLQNSCFSYAILRSHVVQLIGLQKFGRHPQSERGRVECQCRCCLEINEATTR